MGSGASPVLKRDINSAARWKKPFPLDGSQFHYWNTSAWCSRPSHWSIPLWYQIPYHNTTMVPNLLHSLWHQFFLE
jgi:hypothetical protein